MIAAGAGLVGLVIAFVLYQQVNKVKIDNDKVAEITQEIQDGAMAFLFAEYKVLSVFVVVVGRFLGCQEGRGVEQVDLIGCKGRRRRGGEHGDRNAARSETAIGAWCAVGGIVELARLRAKQGRKL